jgi:predicted nuclease with TOPRIM domain
MTDLFPSLACVLVAAMGTFIAHQWLKVFKRRNDLQDKFQAFERANDERITRLKAESAQHVETLENLADACSSLATKHKNLLESQERMVTRLNALEETTKKSISDLGGEILTTVQDMKTQNAAVYVSQQQRQTSRPSFKP